MPVREFKKKAKSALLKPAQFFNAEFSYVGRMEYACARGALDAATRRFDPLKTWTWEFSAFSQNGEDGIIDHLLGQIREPSRYFMEIGTSDGLENNSAYLAYVKGYSGITVEGNPFLAAKAKRFLQRFNWSVKYLSSYVTPERVGCLINEALTLYPDLFSMDIDGNDYHVAVACMDAGLRPRVVCVEYNSAFGPESPLTIPYTPGFDVATAHPTRLYYGASLGAWKKLFLAHDYRFVTVDQRGINAFFVSDEVDLSGDVEGVPFAENAVQLLRADGQTWEEQFEIVSSLPLAEV